MARHDTDAIRAALPVERALEVWGIQPDRARSRPGRELWYRCPLHREKTPSFKVDPRKGLFHCFGCHQGGDVIALVVAFLGLQLGAAIREAARMAGIAPEEDGIEPLRRMGRRDLHRAARHAGAAQFPRGEIAGVTAETDRIRAALEAAETEDAVRAAAGDAAALARRSWEFLRAAAEAEDRAAAGATALSWWRAAEPSAPGGGVARYLAARGLDPDHFAGALPALRLARLWYREDDAERPAMLACFKDIRGEITGAHRTFLREDFAAKADGAAKKWFGTGWGSAIRLGPPAPVMALAEGIETALAYREACLRRGEPVSAWAAGSLGNLAQAVEIPGQVSELHLVADNDTKDRRVLEEALGQARARLAGPGREIRVVVPPRGLDFLDWLRQGVA